MTVQSIRAVRVSPSRLDLDQPGGRGLDQVRGQLEALARAGVLVEVVEEDGREPLGAAARVPADDLVVVHLGQGVGEGGDLRVLVDLGLPAIGDRRREVRAVDDRERAVEDVGDDARALDQRVAAGAQMRDGTVDLGANGRRGAGERGDLGGGDEHVADRCSGLQRSGYRDDRHVRLARRLAQGAAGRRHNALRANGRGGLERGESLLGVARIARAEDHPLG